MSAYSLEELRSMPKEKLVAAHDREAKHASGGLNYYLEELARRDTAEATAAALALTEVAAADSRAVKNLTVVITVLTAVNLLVAIALLADAL